MKSARSNLKKINKQINKNSDYSYSNIKRQLEDIKNKLIPS